MARKRKPTELEMAHRNAIRWEREAKRLRALVELSRKHGCSAVFATVFVDPKNGFQMDAIATGPTALEHKFAQEILTHLMRFEARLINRAAKAAVGVKAYEKMEIVGMDVGALDVKGVTNG